MDGFDVIVIDRLIDDDEIKIIDQFDLIAALIIIAYKHLCVMAHALQFAALHHS